MALINCHECKKQVSTEAKKCPSCGATVKIPKKPTSKIVIFFLGLLGVVTVTMMSIKSSDTAAANNAEAARIAAMTPEQHAQAKAAKDKLDAEVKAKNAKETEIKALAVAGAKALKASSKDPVSFEFISIDTHPNSSVCYEYRAKNSYNAMLAGQAVLFKGKLLVHERDKNVFVAAWNKNCTTPDGTNAKTFVTLMLE